MARTSSTDPVLVEPATAAIASGVRPAARSSAMASATGPASSRNRSSDGDHPQRALGEPEHVQRPADGEMGLVAGVHPHALQVGCRAGRRAMPRSLASQTSRARVIAMMLAMTPPEVRTPQPSVAEPDEVAEPPGDLFLDEGADRSGVPDVDPLVDPLRQHLAGDRHRQRGRREVAERARMLGVVGVRRHPLSELGQDLVRGRRGHRRGDRLAAGPEEGLAGLRVGLAMHGALHRMVVEPVEGLSPGGFPERFQRRARTAGIADVDQLGFGAPIEAIHHGGEGNSGLFRSARDDGHGPPCTSGLRCSHVRTGARGDGARGGRPPRHRRGPRRPRAAVAHPHGAPRRRGARCARSDPSGRRGRRARMAAASRRRQPRARQPPEGGPGPRSARWPWACWPPPPRCPRRSSPGTRSPESCRSRES